jgi:hypothetical protein
MYFASANSIVAVLNTFLSRSFPHGSDRKLNIVLNPLLWNGPVITGTDPDPISAAVMMSKKD